jgi:hypothetical protein
VSGDSDARTPACPRPGPVSAGEVLAAARRGAKVRVTDEAWDAIGQGVLV